MKGQSIPYSDAELRWIKRNRDLPRRDLHTKFCALFDRKDVSRINLTALCKRKGWLTGRTGCYEKGRVPENKGKRMPYNERSAATQFKSGQRPHTWRGPGHESTDKDGYVWLIVAETNPHTGADTRRVMKHRWLWEQANGPVPDGHVLKALDGDRGNTDPSNWRVIPRALLPRLTGRFGRDYDAAPDELKPLIMATAELAQIASEKRKRHG
ncbi:HNH endonuclease signature motif containing protein [Pararhodobacter zhoushanensis]|uniref:HNH endonuclease n=1 Tax=Pararhodobacter zhoushanensis TaxID=2479545 RepID=A0ABT3GYP3_9RHOB|nr:HNH endonuclease signature motif containing protein [Pararhodobacter zhoushanensis]MCW1932647.1 HNH endonuclease [Pararhodobacter zhoushanensis]